ncbi:MFS transporter [Roseococcus sp. SYP-B2431]|uniref:MFS transporter n=1 Tax=Roseococcus sp. SYP-B2431 TaxID=2496640 RepID=UPI00103DD504|nr:MFS transporter [Roseococcus sp. SYP-B2431]TCH96404.1 MFS transporter [Roseococcus sp. SYP-B2431]
MSSSQLAAATPRKDDLPILHARFFGWRVTWAAFTVAVFGWGMGFYGPPVFLFAVHEARGWPVWMVSVAVTCHFLLGAFWVANLPALHRRFGVAAITRAGGLLSLCGMLGWALAEAPWQLFLATAVSGAGWAATGAAAINAMVAPWFVRRRPAALSTAYNGASVGGILLSPLWVVAIGALGFPWAVALVGGAMALTLWWLAGRYLSTSPAELGQEPDGGAAGPPAAKPVPRHASLPGRAMWTNRRFLTLVAGTSLGLFAQIGLIAHLFSLMAGPMGPGLAGLAAGLATACAILGRTGMGWLLTPTADRRIASAGNYGLQVVGSLVLLASGGSDVTLLLLGVALFGLGLGNATSLPPLIAQQDFCPADTARAVALSTACGQAAYAFAPAAFGAMRDIFADTDAFFLTAAAVQVMAAIAMLAGRQPSR